MRTLEDYVPSLNPHDLEVNSTCGMSVTCNVSNQKEKIMRNKFNIPFDCRQYLESYDRQLALVNL